MKKMTNAVILDVNRDDREYYVQIFRTLGVHVSLETSDPIECLKHISQMEVSILITDIVMPGIDGTDFIHTVRNISPNTVIIVSTLLVSKYHVDICSELGIDRYVNKPVNKQIFTFILSQYLFTNRSRNDIIFEKKENIEFNNELMDEIIQNLNLPFHIKGTLYTRIAIKEMLQMKTPLEDILITKEIYPHIAKVCNTSVSKVERNIRYCIDYILSNNTLDYISPEKYGVNSNGNYKLSNGKFLMILAQRVMNELCAVIPVSKQ